MLTHRPAPVPHRRRLTANGRAWLGGAVLGLTVPPLAATATAAAAPTALLGPVWLPAGLALAGMAYALRKLRRPRSAPTADELFSRAVLDHSPQLLGLLTPEGHVLRINRASGTWTGCQPEQLVGRLFWLSYIWSSNPKQAEQLRLAVAEAALGCAVKLDLRLGGNGDAAIRHAEVSLRPVRLTPNGPVDHLLLEAIDTTTRRQSEEKLKLAAAVFEQAHEGIMITDADGLVVSVNQAFTQITGYAPEDVQGRYPAMLTNEFDGLHKPGGLHDALWRSGQWQGEVRNLRRDGSAYTAALSMVRRTDDEGRTTHLIGILGDITQHRQNERRLMQMSHYDALTGLPNRSLLVDRVGQAINLARRDGTTFALMYMDLDLFKHVNDTLGHTVGDALLIDLAERLRRTLDESHTVARLGGDEFAALLPRVNAEEAATIAAELLASVAQPCKVQEHELSRTLSIGIAMFPADGDNMESLSRCADTAMYRAKQDGGASWRFFSADMQERSARQLQLDAGLRSAVDRGELLLHYQPQLSLDGNVIGVEALLRWRHPELGMISPGEFIPLAEDSGMIVPIGAWVMRTAAQQMKRWMDEGLAPTVVAVNISAIQFRDPLLPQQVRDVLQDTGLPPACLELELTESVATGNLNGPGNGVPAAAIAMMDSLHALGVRLSIDDFGTGWSSLNYLKGFRIDTLKIDQSFVRDIGSDPVDRAIVLVIMQLARALKLHTIAEGVETDEQFQFLREHGCDIVQGYLFCRPLEADAAIAWMKNRARSEPALA